VRRSLDQGLIATSTAAAAFLVHQARYLIVPDPTASDGHGYLGFAPEVLTFAFALSAGLALRSAMLRRAEDIRRRRHPLAEWARCCAVLMGVFTAQELLEGHAAALLDLTGTPVLAVLAALFGAALTVVLRRGRRTMVALARTMRGRVTAALPRAVRCVFLATTAASPPRSPVCGRMGAGRAPPLTVST
jgi:hypothetical protein